MERKDLLCDLGYALQLSGRLLQKFLDLLLIIRMRGEINQVGQRFQRVIDFMRDGLRQSPGGRQLFRMAQSFFRQLALSDVGEHHDGAKSLLVRHYRVGRNQKPCLSVLLLGNITRGFRMRKKIRAAQHLLQDRDAIVSNYFAESFSAQLYKGPVAAHNFIFRIQQHQIFRQRRLPWIATAVLTAVKLIPPASAAAETSQSPPAPWRQLDE